MGLRAVLLATEQTLQSLYWYTGELTEFLI